MILITSAAYVSNELKIEFGDIPPCLLPIGNRTLLELQTDAFRKSTDEQIFVSLPDDYVLSDIEHQVIKSLHVEIIPVPPELSLAESVLYSLNIMHDYADFFDSFKLLHGDTLMSDFINDDDVIAVAPSTDDYNWEKENYARDNLVWCGYFTFSMPRTLIKCLTLSQKSFVQAVRRYDQTLSLKRIQAQNWYDLGHLNTYFLSRSRITTQRAFNAMRIENGIVWKSGTNTKKIAAEGNWFKKIPTILKPFIPQLIEDGIDSVTERHFYVLEYLPYNPLNEIFVHGKNPEFFWSRIFSLTRDYLTLSNTAFNKLEQPALTQDIALDAEELYRAKTFLRLGEYTSKNNISMDEPVIYNNIILPSLHQIATDCVNKTMELPLVPGILHGDLCFSNILFNSRLNSIKVLDPRGVNQKGELTIFGDQKYDLAKACHSVVGLYDYIISGRFQLKGDIFTGASIDFNIDGRINNIQQDFFEREFLEGISIKQIMPLTTLLFLSMLPLHDDRPDRQQAMLVNALRLYSTYVYNNRH